MNQSTKTSNLLKNHYSYLIEKLITKNGPDRVDYPFINSIMEEIIGLKKIAIFKNEDILDLQKIFGEPMTTAKTLQGFVCVKPHGYAGDFEIIDKIYTYCISQDEQFNKWDLFFHEQAAPKAVRNRKDYLKNLLSSKTQEINVLNLASGPCRDIAEYFNENQKTKIIIDCIEVDEKAIDYAKNILQSHSVEKNRYNIVQKNIFKFIPNKKYELIWSAGLFDYFNDKVFISLLNRFYNFVEDEGEMVVGNFDTCNPSRAYMEFGFWNLYHRTKEELMNLAIKSGIPKNKIEVV